MVAERHLSRDELNRSGTKCSEFSALLPRDTASDICDFSTKYYDQETGLIDYGHRFYSPSQGRFLGRDPAEEQGGLNLYGFCGNNAINAWDVLGMMSVALGFLHIGPDGGGAIVYPVDNYVNSFAGGAPAFSLSMLGLSDGVDLTGQFDANPDAHLPADFNLTSFVAASEASWNQLKSVQQGGANAQLAFSVGEYSIVAGPDGGRGTALTGGAVGLGFEAYLTGALRDEYARRAAQLAVDDVAARNALKLEFRARQTALGKAITQEILKQRAAAGQASGVSNATKTNAGINQAGEIMKNGGRVLTILGIAGEVYTVVTTPQQERAAEAPATEGTPGLR